MFNLLFLFLYLFPPKKYFPVKDSLGTFLWELRTEGAVYKKMHCFKFCLGYPFDFQFSDELLCKYDLDPILKWPLTLMTPN